MRRGVELVFIGGTQDHPRRPGYLGRGDTPEIVSGAWRCTRPGALVMGRREEPPPGGCEMRGRRPEQGLDQEERGRGYEDEVGSGPNHRGLSALGGLVRDGVVV